MCRLISAMTSVMARKCSRMWVASHAAPTETIEAALDAMAAAEAEWGR